MTTENITLLQDAILDPLDKALEKTYTKRAVQKIDEMIKIQTDSTGNGDDYFLGMTNGMICIRSILSGEAPQYVESEGRNRSDLLK